jgi:hypothetical protein
VCVLLLFLLCWTNIFRDFVLDVTSIHDKGKLFPIVDPTTRHFESKVLTLKSLYSPNEFASMYNSMFFENTEIHQRDVQVLDHILTMEIKTHFILNLPRPKITTANACATRPPKTVGIYGGGGGGGRPPPAHFPLFGICKLCNGKQHMAVYISHML